MGFLFPILVQALLRWYYANNNLEKGSRMAKETRGFGEKNQLINDLTLRIQNARREHEEESSEVQIPLLARRLEKALAKQLAGSHEVQEFEVPMEVGCRIVKAVFYKEVNFGFAGRRRFVALFRNNQWEIEYWYTSQNEPNGFSKGKTAEEALKGLLPSLTKTHAWNLKSENRNISSAESGVWDWKPGTQRFRF